MPLKSKILDINFVGQWKYNCLNEDCSICRLEIQSNEKVSIGMCGHGYHKKCISDWLKNLDPTDHKCPMCYSHWQEISLNH